MVVGLAGMPFSSALATSDGVKSASRSAVSTTRNQSATADAPIRPAETPSPRTSAKPMCGLAGGQAETAVGP